MTRDELTLSVYPLCFHLAHWARRRYPKLTRAAGGVPDLAQAALLRVLEQADTYDPDFRVQGKPVKPGTYLHHIALHAIQDLLRKERHRTREVHLADQGWLGKRTAPLLDGQEEVASLLECLHERERQVVTLHCLEGRTLKETTARIGGVTIQRIQALYSRALNRMERKMHRRDATVDKLPT